MVSWFTSANPWKSPLMRPETPAPASELPPVTFPSHPRNPYRRPRSMNANFRPERTPSSAAWARLVMLAERHCPEDYGGMNRPSSEIIRAAAEYGAAIRKELELVDEVRRLGT